jgi:CRP-like cAMP-binding protein
MVWMEGNKNEYLFQQGETGHSFFLIESGVVGVEVDGIRVGSLNKGQSFGELALLFRASRAASIIC